MFITLKPSRASVEYVLTVGRMDLFYLKFKKITIQFFVLWFTKVWCVCSVKMLEKSCLSRYLQLYTAAIFLVSVSLNNTFFFTTSFMIDLILVSSCSDRVHDVGVARCSLVLQKFRSVIPRMYWQEPYPITTIVYSVDFEHAGSDRTVLLYYCLSFIRWYPILLGDAVVHNCRNK